MKSSLYPIAVLLISISAGSANADPLLLNCSATGDALALLQLRADGTVSIQVSEDDDSSPSIYNVQMGLKDVQAGTSATVIASAKDARTFGGATDHSILLRVVDGQKSAYLGMDGSVYRLRCF